MMSTATVGCRSSVVRRQRSLRDRYFGKSVEAYSPRGLKSPVSTYTADGYKRALARASWRVANGCSPRNARRFRDLPMAAPLGRPAIVAIVAPLTVIQAYADELPQFHHLAVPLAVAVTVSAWVLELSGVRWPRLALIGATVLPTVWLTLTGHNTTNYLWLHCWSFGSPSRARMPKASPLSSWRVPPSALTLSFSQRWAGPTGSRGW